MYHMNEKDSLNVIIGGGYTYYQDEDGIADLLEDILHKGNTKQNRNDKRTAFYHEYLAYNDGWEN